MDPEDLFFDPYADVRVTYRNLPHWRQEGKLYFVTWRQADGIPAEQRRQLRTERAAWLREYGDPSRADDLSRPCGMTAFMRRRYDNLFNGRVQRWLDAGAGSCVLKQEAPRRIMGEALHRFQGVRYHLGSFAIAANHVHPAGAGQVVLVAPVPDIGLSEVVHGWKSFTANAINRAVVRRGALWHGESYDHLVRSESSLRRIEAYIHAHKDQGGYVERRRL